MREKKPVPMPRKETDASRFLLPNTPAQTHPVDEFEVKPGEQEHVSLGDFAASSPPKGFSIEITPEHDPDDVVAQITRLDGEYDKCQLFLHVANYGGKTLSVEVLSL